MTIEFVRMTVRRGDGTSLRVAGPVVLQNDGAIDLGGDAVAHAADIVAAVEAFDPVSPLVALTAAEQAGAGGDGPSLVADRIRIGDTASLTPLVLRPGRPAAIAAETDPATWAAVWRALALFRAVRSIARTCAA